ncbi:MAG: hypothetical protein ACOC56_02635 [Atribacterota bacterium]
MIAKSVIQLSGNIIMFFLVLNFYIFVIVACISGTYSLNVYFNGFGEGPLECIAYMIISPIVAYAMILNVKDFIRYRKVIKKEKT